MQKPRYRRELKYEIGVSDYIAIRQRIKTVMKADIHAGEDGKYQIRSVYFDNTDDKALREKINGIAKREKFRIRYYNDDFSFLTLEKKIKDNNLCLKIDAPITQSECKRLLCGDTAWMMQSGEPLVNELYVKMKTQQLRPRVLVSYVREPYVYAAGNVRVTFDSQIRTSLYSGGFFTADVHDISATDTAQTMILEVKYDDYLPEIISHLIQTPGLRQGAFSKYGSSRRFG